MLLISKMALAADVEIDLEVLPFQSNLARKFLSVPGRSVPAERVFSKTGELISNRRSSIKPKHVDMMIFLNKNFKK